MQGSLAIAMISLALPPFPQDETTKALVANIAANERLYQDIDATVEHNYKLREFKYASPSEAVEAKLKIRSVTQNDWFSLKHSNFMTLIDKTVVDQDSVAEFDGRQTRSVQKGGFGNLTHNRTNPSLLFQSHSLLMYPYGWNLPLSLLLSEGDPFRTHPNGEFLAQARHQVSIKGEEARDGLLCKIVECKEYRENRPGNQLWATLKLWIAVDRNFLVHRSESWRYNKEGDSFLCGVVEAEEYQELEPGVWLTKRFRAKSYDFMKFCNEQQRDVLQTESHYQVSQVKLNPSYPQKFFQQVQFPKGMLVYEVENGKIIRSLIDGIPVRNPASPPSPRRWPHYLATALALAFALAGAWFLRRWRTRRPMAASATP